MKSTVPPVGSGGPHTGQVTFRAYERLQQGLGPVSLQAIVAENSMLRYALAQQVRLGKIRIVGFSVDWAKGWPTDVWLRLVEGELQNGTVQEPWFAT